MIIGISATALTLVALFISIAAYFLYDRRNDPELLLLARISFYTASGLVFSMAVLLMWGLLTHQFQWAYVLNYSSKKLPLFYLISAFWAGQEGTFLLWLVFGSIYGFFIIRNRKDQEPLAMAFMGLVQAFVVIILIKKNPFEYIWNVNPALFPKGVIPLDGSGLNPLLQDPWMVIHPPILFAGYSSTMILFAFAMTALIKRNYDNWIKAVYPYALFSALMLGAGIILGAYWSYTTLGWGGYWGWDPVENSSLIPWLTSLALMHGIIIQKKQGGLKKTNIFLTLLTFILVLYASFLTRSGVLTDFSVHSFGSSELNFYLIGFMGLFFTVSAVAFLFRIKEAKGEKIQTALFSRESFILFGLLIVLALAILTFVGTSSPIITGIFGTASNVSSEYYNLLIRPVAILMAILIALAPVFRWKRDSLGRLNKLIIHAVVSLVAGVLFFFLGMKDAIYLGISILAVFAILVNGQIIYLMLKHKKYNFGGYLTHVGIGLMMIGIITSSVYDQSVKAFLPLGEQKEVLGYQMIYGGKFPAPDGKDKVALRINGKKMFAKFFWSDYSRAFMVAPAVKNSLLRDFYVSPIQIKRPNNNQPLSDEIVVRKNKKTAFRNLVLEFTGYEFNNHQMEAGDVHVAAVIKILDQNGKLLKTIKPALTVKGNKRVANPAVLPDGQSKVFLKMMNVEKGSLTLAVTKKNTAKNSSAGKELLIAELSIKPLINVLWLGTILLVAGFLLTLFQIRKKKPVSAS